MIDEEVIRQRWEGVGSRLDERGRRLFAAGEVRTAGWGGLAVVSRVAGLARSTINRGRDDLDAEPLPQTRTDPLRMDWPDCAMVSKPALPQSLIAHVAALLRQDNRGSHLA